MTQKSEEKMNPNILDIPADTPRVVPYLGLIALSAERRLSGPTPRDARTLITPEDLSHNMDKDTPPVVREVAERVIAKYNRLLSKRGLSPDAAVPADIVHAATDIVQKISDEDPELKLSKQMIIGVSQLVRDMEPERAKHYLDEEFVYELQDTVPESSAMWQAVGNYFKVSKLLKYAANTKDPDLHARRTVERAWQIEQDPKEYLAGLTGESIDDEFFSALDSELLLELVSTLPQSYKERLLRAAQRFGEMKQKFPLLFAADSTLMLTELLQNVSEAKLENYDRVAKLFIREGMAEENAVFMSIRYANGSINAELFDRILASAGRGRLRLFNTESKTNPRFVSKRIQRAVESGLFTDADGALAAQGIEFRDAMFDIAESDAFSRGEVRRALDDINAARVDHAAYTYNSEQVVGEKFSDNERRQYNRALAKALYALKYYDDYGTREQIVPMGSKEVPVSMTKEQMMTALAYLSAHAKHEAMLVFDAEAVDGEDDGNNLELGYPLRVESNMLVLTKKRYAPVVSGYERGKSPRINRTCGVNGNTPSLVAGEREYDSLSLRLDLDSDGVLRLDIGGKTDDPNSPDFLVAKLLSLGGWYRSQIHDDAASDYHVDIDSSMTPDEFARIASRYRRAIQYVPEMPRIVDGRVRDGQQDQAAA